MRCQAFRDGCQALRARRFGSGWSRTGRREQGYLLLIALFVLIVTMAMSSALAAALMLRMERLERQQSNLQLTALLDAALSRSLAELSDHPGWQGTGGEIPFGDGTYAADATWLGNSRVEVRLSASYGRYGRAAEAEIDTYLKQVVRWQPLAFDLESPDGIPRGDGEGAWGD